jgi:aconitate hydratase 2 / 2-methylisocitrate dehydratase
MKEYLQVVASKIDPFADELYRYLNFNEIKGFEDEGRVVPKAEEEKIEKEALAAG